MKLYLIYLATNYIQLIVSILRPFRIVCHTYNMNVSLAFKIVFKQRQPHANGQKRSISGHFSVHGHIHGSNELGVKKKKVISE